MADNKAQEEAQKKEEQESKKEVVTVCTLNVRQILVALHEKALSEIKGEITIQNSAIEGSGGKDAKFYGAGQHIIAAIPKDNKGIANNKIEKKDAVEPLQAYVQWFVGPDLKGKVTENILKPLEDGADGKVADNHEKKEDIEKSKDDSIAGEKYEKDEAKKESSIFVPSFSQYLLIEDGEENADNEKAAEDKGKEDKKVKDKNAEDAKDVKGDPGKGPNQAQGWYVEYKMTIPGQKEHSIADALKNFAKDIVKAFGVKFGSIFGGSGKVHTIGDLVDSIEAVFGKMNVDDFQKAVKDELTKRMKVTKADAQIWDTPTILKYLKKEVSKYKSKIAPVKYALCVKVSKNDPSYKLFNEDAIANIVNSAISSSEVMRGLGKRLKGFGIKGKDVILVNNYEENKNADAAKKGEVADSLIVKNKHNLIKDSIDIYEVKNNIIESELQRSFNNYNTNRKKESIVALQKNDYSFVSRLFESSEFNSELQMLLNEANTTYVDEIIYKIDEIGIDAIKANKKAIIDKFDQIIDKKKKNIDYKETDGYKKILDALFNVDSTEKSIEQFKEIANDKGYSKLLGYLKPCLDGIEKEEKKETAKVNFYDADPKTGEKTGDPLNKEPFEVEKDSMLKDNEEINSAIVEFNEQLKKNTSDGYTFSGWNPDINNAKASDDETDIVAKYVEEEKKDEEFTVQLMYAPDQEKPNATEIIKIDDKEEQKVKFGEAAKLPEKMPEIEGYKFKDWGDDTEKLQKVEEDINAVAQYEKDEQPAEEKTFDINIKAKHTELDFYIVPMKGLKDKDKHKDNTSK